MNDRYRGFESRIWACSLAPALFTALWFAQTQNNGFVWDDLRIFGEPAMFANAASIWAWVTAPFLDSSAYFRPLALLTLAAEYVMGGGSPAPLHLVNVGIHAVNTLLVGILAASVVSLKLPPVRARPVAVLVSGLAYGFHPALIEGVSWISARFDLLATFFALAALVCDRLIRRTAPRALVCAAFFLCGALCKEMMLGFLLLLPFWHALCARGSLIEIFRSAEHRAIYGTCLIAGLAYLGLRAHFLPGLLDTSMTVAAEPLGQRLILIGKTLGRYVLLALWPFPRLSPVHGLNGPLTMADAEVWVGILALGGAALGLALGKGIGRICALLAACFLMNLLPVSQLIPLIIADSFVAERFLLMPMSFVALAVGVITSARLSANSEFLWTATGGAVLATWVVLAALAQWTIVPAWRSEESLWTYAYGRAPLSTTAANNLLTVYIERGEVERAQAFAELIRERQGGHFYTTQQINYAYLLSLQGRHEEALGYIGGAEGAMEADDRRSQHHLRQTWGFVAMNAGDLDAAVRQYQKAIAVLPGIAEAHYYLGIVLMAQGSTVEGQNELERAYTLTTAADAKNWRDGVDRNVSVAAAKAEARRRGMASGKAAG